MSVSVITSSLGGKKATVTPQVTQGWDLAWPVCITPCGLGGSVSVGLPCLCGDEGDRGTLCDFPSLLL